MYLNSRRLSHPAFRFPLISLALLLMILLDFLSRYCSAVSKLRVLGWLLKCSSSGHLGHQLWLHGNWKTNSSNNFPWHRLGDKPVLKEEWMSGILLLSSSLLKMKQGELAGSSEVRRRQEAVSSSPGPARKMKTVKETVSSRHGPVAEMKPTRARKPNPGYFGSDCVA